MNEIAIYDQIMDLNKSGTFAPARRIRRLAGQAGCRGAKPRGNFFNKFGMVVLRLDSKGIRSECPMALDEKPYLLRLYGFEKRVACKFK